MLPWLDASARIVNRRCRFTRLRHTLPAEDEPAANISINLASIFTYSRRPGDRANRQAWSIPIVRKFSSIHTLDASPGDENPTEFSKHPRNDPTTHVSPGSRIPSLSRGIPAVSEDLIR